MASNPILDLDQLIAPIPGENPAGTPLDISIRQELDQAREDFEVHPIEGDIPKNPEFDKIVDISLENLCTQSKDLRLAVYLTEGLTKENGFPGLRDGLKLLGLMISQCWDRMHPALDPEDPESPEARGDLLLNLLNDNQRGLLFPYTVRSAPLVLVDGTPRSYQEKTEADDGKGELTTTDFEKAQPLNNDIAEDVDQALEELGNLHKALDEKLENAAPRLLELEKAIQDCKRFLAYIQPEEEEAEEEDEEESNGEAGTTPAKEKTGKSRADLYKQLAQIANALEKIEPHSPIPDMLRRAVRLGKMPFKDLIREIVRDESLLSEVDREYGIDRPQGAEED